MREIEFRGKRVDNGEWVYGFVSIHTFCGDQTRLAIVIVKCPVNIYDYDSHEVIPETVGQFTGLKDKNGVEIFEGDVVELKGDFKFVFGLNIKSNDISTTRNEIVWHNDGWGLKWLYSNEWSDVQCTARGHVTAGATAKMVKYMTVIGNIHQHPELLEVKC